MAEAARIFEVERPIADVWRAYSDFETWSACFDLDLLIISTHYRFFWQGPPAPGSYITIEINGERRSEWLAKEWDAPTRLRVVGATPGLATFSLGLSLTRQTDVSTVVDLKLAMQPLGRLGKLATSGFVARRSLESLIRTANKRFLTEAA